MISTEDWDLIKGALEDVASYDDGDDSEAAKDLLKRIESGDAQATIQPDSTAGRRDATGDILYFLRAMEAAVRRQGAENIMHQLKDPLGLREWHYQIDPKLHFNANKDLFRLGSTGVS